VYMDRVLEIWRQWQAVVTERGRASVYVGNLGGGIRTVKNVRRLGEVAAWFNADHQGRSGDTPIWDCAQQGRVAQAVMSGRTITSSRGLSPQRRFGFYGSGEPAGGSSEYLQGLYYALLDGRFLFDFVHEDAIGPETARRYQALLLPNAAYLDDEHCQRIR